MSKPTIQDVAKHANVSTTTVSHVINNTRFVAESTRTRVLESIKALHYSPDAMARMLKTGKKNLIGFVMPDFSSTFQVTLIEEIETIVARQGYRLIVASTKEQKDIEAAHVRALDSGMVDGLIVASTMSSYEEFQRLCSPTLPIVFVDRMLSGCPCDTITISSYNAFYKGVSTLIQEGHRRIGYIDGAEYLSSYSERFIPFRDAMAAHNITVEENLIRHSGIVHRDKIRHISELIEMGCTALILPHTIRTDDILFYLFENHTNRFGNISILAVSDMNKPDYYVKNMHTVRFPIKEMGQRIGEQILRRIGSPDMPSENITINSFFLPASKE